MINCVFIRSVITKDVSIFLFFAYVKFELQKKKHWLPQEIGYLCSVLWYRFFAFHLSLRFAKVLNKKQKTKTNMDRTDFQVVSDYVESDANGTSYYYYYEYSYVDENEENYGTEEGKIITIIHVQYICMVRFLVFISSYRVALFTNRLISSVPFL